MVAHIVPAPLVAPVHTNMSGGVRKRRAARPAARGVQPNVDVVDAISRKETGLGWFEVFAPEGGRAMRRRVMTGIEANEMWHNKGPAPKVRQLMRMCVHKTSVARIEEEAGEEAAGE